MDDPRVNLQMESRGGASGIGGGDSVEPPRFKEYYVSKLQD